MTMTYILMILLLLAGAVIQSITPAYTVLGGVKLPVITALVLYYSLNRNNTVMLISATIAGILQDSLSITPLGYSSSIYILLGWIIGNYRTLVAADSFMTPVIFGAVIGMAVTILQTLLLIHNEFIVFHPLMFILRTFGNGILCMIISPIVFIAAKTLEKAVGNLEIRENSSEIS